MNIEIKYRTERARKTFVKLAKRIKDLNPIWDQFIAYWQTDLMPKVWDSKGKAMEGKRWEPYTKKYLKWKQKNYSGQPMLKLTGKLFDAVRGGSGWYDKKQKDNLEIGVKGYDYWEYVQYRRTKGRWYFNTPEGSMPARVWAYLIRITDNALEECDDDK